MTTDCDAVVVGAGHNGLAAAVHLSARGWKVIVLERQPVAGGAVKTAELTLPGFRHDLYAMNLSLFAGSPFLAAHRQSLEDAGLAFAVAPRSFASSFLGAGGAHWLGVEQGLEATAGHLARRSTRDAARWRELSAGFEACAPHLFAMLGSPMPSWDAVHAAWRAARAVGAPALARLVFGSTRAWLDRHFEDDAVKALLAVWGMHLDFAPDIAGGAMFPYLEAMASQRFGMALGQGGADVMIRAMTGAIERAGGTVRTSCEVARIEVSGRRAQAVLMADGERIRARRAVIANVHPRVLYDRLLDARDAASGARARRLRPGPATMMIHLAVTSLPDWRAGQALRDFAYVHLAHSFEQMARTYAEAMAGRLPSEPVLVVGQPTAIDPTRAPAGRHVLWIQVRALPFEVRGDAAGEIEPGGWDVIKDRYAERVLDLLERHAPGIRASVLGRSVLSPLDLQRDNPNLVGGDSLGGSHHLDQFFVFRPALGQSRWCTRVDGLHLVGASTWPGAGTGAGSGYMLACDLAGR